MQKQPACGDTLLVTLESAGGGEQKLLVEAKNNGQPRIALGAAYALHKYIESVPGAYGVFLAPYISEAAANICVREGVGYVDLAGNCRLCFGHIFIERKGNPNPFNEKRDLRSLYSPKAERVLRVLLTTPGRTWKIVELANEAGVSIGQISNVKKLLTDREWLRTGQGGFALAEPQQLLSEWAKNYRFRKNATKDFYSLKAVSEIEADLCAVCEQNGVRYALTGFSGAARLALGVRYQRVIAYVAKSEIDVAARLGLKEAPSGANVTLLTPYDEGVFYAVQEIGGSRIASSIQIYLDLMSFRGRGEEAAQLLLDNVIKAKW
ncbi:MAG: type IV toxin-antitoxin system AbiEi family antitoxin [Planctomycetota bacterium]